MDAVKLKEWFMGGLAKKDYGELLSLEYVLTWGYSDQPKKDENRYKELSKILWDYRELNPITN